MLFWGGETVYQFFDFIPSALLVYIINRMSRKNVSINWQFNGHYTVNVRHPLAIRSGVISQFKLKLWQPRKCVFSIFAFRIGWIPRHTLKLYRIIEFPSDCSHRLTVDLLCHFCFPLANFSNACVPQNEDTEATNRNTASQRSGSQQTFFF